METNDMIPKENKQTAPEASPKHSRQKLKKIITGCIIAAAAIGGALGFAVWGLLN